MTNKNYSSDTYAPQNITAPASLAIGALAVDVLMTAVLITGMVIDKHSVTLSVLSGTAFFLLFGTFVILILSGTATQVITNGQHEKTVRHMYDLQYDAEMEQLRVTVADRPRLAYTPPAPSLQLPDSPTYVSAVPSIEARTRADAYTYVMQISNADGKLVKVTRNAHQVQHKNPTREAIEYMKALDMVTEDGGAHLYWNTTLYPVAQYAINAIRTGRKPSLEEGRGRGEEEGNDAET